MPSSVLATALSADSQSDSQSETDSAVPTPEPSDSRRARALLIACITIALERFAFYTLVSLFVLFLTERRGHSEAQATTWYGVMMGATYFTPLIGGAVADRFGRWPCIAIGVFLLAISYGLLTAGFLSLSIILLSIGMGLFKGNITAAVGSLYQTETERDLSLNRLYWAANLGALPSRIRWRMAREELRILRCIPLCHRSLSARELSVDALRKHSVPRAFTRPSEPITSSRKRPIGDDLRTASGCRSVLPFLSPEWFLADSVREGSHRSVSVGNPNRSAVVSECSRRAHPHAVAAAWAAVEALATRESPQVHARNVPGRCVQSDHVRRIYRRWRHRARQSVVAPDQLLRDFCWRAVCRADRILSRDQARSQAPVRSPDGRVVRRDCSRESWRWTHRKVLVGVAASLVLLRARNDIGIRGAAPDAATESS